MADKVLYFQGDRIITQTDNGLRVAVGTHSDYPVKWDNGLLAWDSPEAIPDYIKVRVADILNGWTITKSGNPYYSQGYLKEKA